MSFYSYKSKEVNPYRCLTITTKAVGYRGMNLGTRIREQRKAKGWSQAKLAEESGISQQMLSKLERGKAFGTTEIVDLARALQVSPQWLESGEEPMQAQEITQADREIISEIHTFDPESQKLVYGTIKAMLPALKLQLQFQARGVLSPPPPPNNP